MPKIKINDSERVQYFNDVMFVRDETTGYFTSHAKQGNTSMHHYVWKNYNGEIPEGCIIHHKDHNRANNAIDNLECMTAEAHRKYHNEHLTDEQRQWRRDNMNTNARPKAIEWHKSDKGRQWHKEQAQRVVAEGKNYFSKIQPVLRVCEICGKEFYRKPSSNPNRQAQHHFCSGACAQKYRRLYKLDAIEKICPVCGKVFKTSKHQPATTCGHSCADKLRWQEGGCFAHRKRKGN